MISWRVVSVSMVFFLVATGGSVLTPRAADAQTLKHNCSFCHNLHGASYPQLSDFELQEDLCWSCHDNAILGDTQVLRDGTPVTVPQNGYELHNGPKHSSPTGCWDCHNHENEADGLQGYNLAMIQATMITPAGTDTLDLIFKSRGTDAGQASLYSFADGDEDGDGDYTGVCEVCHTATTNHRNGIDLPDPSNHAHEVGRTCSDCHTHDGGFAGGGPCASCHDTGGQATLAGRRAIMPELARVSHHVGSGYVDDDCLVCHDQSKHQQGNVRLWDVDSPDTLTSIVLTGNPLTNSAEAAKLSTFCLKCHDADGAGGSVPFSDLVTPPEIDGTAWAASSHEGSVAIVGCFGNGTFGCHASAHGSEKLNLLAPADSAPNATTLYEEEEGFCFRCHDSDGPAGSDLATPFSAATIWIAAERGDNASGKTLNLNDRHDVSHADQTTSGAKVECNDCHDPHSATAAQPWKTDPDPTDGRVPGTGQVYSGATALSEFCMDCHDGSFPATVTAPTDPLIDVRTTWASDAMGGGNGNATLKSGYGWGDNQLMPCEACHSPHVSSNYFHGFETVYSLDGSTAVPSDGGAGYTMTDNSVKNASINGYDWCNTCHTGSMGDKKDNCFACHFHGTRW